MSIRKLRKSVRILRKRYSENPASVNEMSMKMYEGLLNTEEDWLRRRKLARDSEVTPEEIKEEIERAKKHTADTYAAAVERRDEAEREVEAEKLAVKNNKAVNKAKASLREIDKVRDGMVWLRFPKKHKSAGKLKTAIKDALRVLEELGESTPRLGDSSSYTQLLRDLRNREFSEQFRGWNRYFSSFSIELRRLERWLRSAQNSLDIIAFDRCWKTELVDVGCWSCGTFGEISDKEINSAAAARIRDRREQAEQRIRHNR